VIKKKAENNACDFAPYEEIGRLLDKLTKNSPSEGGLVLLSRLVELEAAP
jgi:hypothetical protein